MSLKPPITVVSVVVWDGHRALLGLRQGADAAGTWCCPGGKADEVAPLHHQAARELYEETGLSCWYAELKPFPVWRPYTDEHGQEFTCVYYVWNFWGSTKVRLMEPDKFVEWRWFRPEEIPGEMFPGEREVIDALAAGARP